MLSVVSYPDRGPWGDARYRGNCTGHLLADLVAVYRPRTVVDPAEGGGTSRDVCRHLNLAYVGADLREGFDLASMPLRQRLRGLADLVFFHPPYYRIIRYSGSVWGTAPHAADLSHVDEWEKYLRVLRAMVENCLDATARGGHVAVLIGDVRQAGAYYSAQAHLHRWFAPASLDAVIVKQQHNVASDGRAYAGRLIRIMHEYCLVLRRHDVTTVREGSRDHG